MRRACEPTSVVMHTADGDADGKTRVYTRVSMLSARMALPKGERRCHFTSHVARNSNQ